MVPFPINKLGFINPGLTLPLLIACFVEGGILLGLELMNIGGQYNPQGNVSTNQIQQSMRQENGVCVMTRNGNNQEALYTHTLPISRIMAHNQQNILNSSIIQKVAQQNSRIYLIITTSIWNLRKQNGSFPCENKPPQTPWGGTNGCGWMLS